MASDHAASVQGVALRVTRLNADGTPVEGPTGSFVTDAFMKFGFTPEYTKGQEVEEKGANGNVCIYYQAADVLKRVTMTLDICDPSPELHQMIIGGDLLLPDVGTDAVGYASPELGIDSNPDGVAVEVWSRAIVAGRPASVNPFWRWVFPYAKLYLSGDRTLENGAMANSFQGWGVGNVQYAPGGGADWPYQTDRAYQYARAATAPVGINGYVTVPAIGAPVSEVQTLTFTAPATAGTYTLSYQGTPTTALAFGALAPAIQTALQTVVGAGNVLVTGSAGGPFTITFAGDLANTNVQQLVPNNASLTGGPAVITTATPGGFAP